MSNSDIEMFSLTVSLPHPDLVVSILNGYGKLCAVMVDSEEPEEERQGQGDHNVQYLVHVYESFSVDLPRGLYRIVGKLAGRTEETVVRLNRDQLVDAPVPAVFSAVPLAESQISHEYYTGPATDISRNATWTIGGGRPTLMFFVRALSSENAQANRIHCRLHDRDQQVLMDTRQGGAAIDDDSGWFAFSVDLAPGAYILEIFDSRQTRALPVWISGNFQTQMFALNLDGGIAYDSLRVLNAHTNDGFSPEDPFLRTAELMTTGLVAGMQQPSGQAMREALSGKFQNPMVGLFAAHSLLRRPKLQLPLLEEVIYNLGWMLEDSPDVRALALMLAQAGGTGFNYIEPFTFPPMLQASYNGLIDAASRHPEFVEQGSLCDRIGIGLMTDTPFVCWDPEAVADTSSASLDWIKESIVESLVPKERFGEPTDLFKLEKLPRTLGVTRHVLEEAARSLMEDAGGDPVLATIAGVFDIAQQASPDAWSTLMEVKQKADKTASDAFSVLLSEESFEKPDA
jgi:hypothetical protein